MHCLVSCYYFTLTSKYMRHMEVAYSMLNHFFFIKKCYLLFRMLVTRRSLSLVSQSSAANSRLHLACFAHVRFALTKIFEKKKCVLIDSKCSKTLRNAKNHPFDPWCPSGVVQWNFNTINRTKVPTFSPSLIKIRPIVSGI